MKVDGACLCGAISFEAEINAGGVIVCHCTDCQIQCGSFRTIALADAGSFVLRTGEPAIYSKRAESGATRSLAFCAACGTSIYGGPGEGESGAFSLRIGTLRQCAELRPVAQVWCRSQQMWLGSLQELPRVETQPGVAG